MLGLTQTKVKFLKAVFVFIIPLMLLNIFIMSVAAYLAMSASFNDLDYPKSVKSEYIGYTNSLILGRLFGEVGWDALHGFAHKKQREYYASALKKNNNELDKALWDLWPFYYHFDYSRTQEFLNLMSVICKKYPNSTDAKVEESLHSVYRGALVFKDLVDKHPQSFGRSDFMIKFKDVLVECANHSKSSVYKQKILDLKPRS